MPTARTVVYNPGRAMAYNPSPWLYAGVGVAVVGAGLITWALWPKGETERKYKIGRNR